MKLIGNILIAIVIVAVLVFGYKLYQQHKVENGGEITWLSGKPSDAEHAAFLRKNAGDDQGMTSAAVKPTGNGAMVSNTVTQPAQTTAANTSTQPSVAPTPPNFIPPTNSPSTITTTPVSANTADIPAHDSIAPNPPNGSAFSGTGQYLLYRQGNLTWRLNSATGRTCIAFATLDEWRKPLVLRNGCGRSA